MEDDLKQLKIELGHSDESDNPWTEMGITGQESRRSHPCVYELVKA